MRISQTVKHIIIINCIICFGSSFFGNKYFFDTIFALHYPMNDSFQYWQIVTHMFMHDGFFHLLVNMFALWMFGSSVEQVFGQRKFLFFYISCGLWAAGLQLLVYHWEIQSLFSVLETSGVSSLDISNMLTNGSYNTSLLQFTDHESLESAYNVYNSSMVGASGAIMGILVAFGMLNPNAELMFILFPIPIKAKYFIPGIILFDLFSAITGVAIFSPTNTAFVAHIGGALTGFIIMYFWKKNQFDKFRWN